MNVQGFSRICGKIDRKMSPGLSKLILSNYVHNMGYCKDFAEDGNGTYVCVCLYIYMHIYVYIRITHSFSLRPQYELEGGGEDA